MKRRIYRTLCLLTICGLAACGKKDQSPTVSNTPTATPTPMTTVVPAPVATVPPSQLPPAPIVIKTPKPNVSISPAPPKLAALPESIYPTPTPVAIPIVPEPVKIKTNSKPDPISKIRIPDAAQQITPVGIGAAKIGMTFKELKATVGSGYEFPVKTSFIEGFDAIAVTKGGRVQYYIPYATGTNFTDADRIQHLMTDNPNYRTAQGVGPGTPIGQAASIYGGGATLSMSKENESREFINFERHPNGMAFRPKPIGTRSFAGDYPESNEDYLKTQKYDKRAAIGQITVSCPEDKCEAER